MKRENKIKSTVNDLDSFIQFLPNFFIVLCHGFCCLSSPGFKSDVLMFHSTTSWTSCKLYCPIFPINFWVMFD